MEPHPLTFGYLARDVELNGMRNVSLCCAAVESDSQRMVSLGFDAGHSGGASLVEKRGNTIDVLTIHRGWFSWVGARSAEGSLIKIDVEVAEDRVLHEVMHSGLEPLLDAILIEMRHNLEDGVQYQLTRAGFSEVEREAGCEADDVFFRRARAEGALRPRGADSATTWRS